MSQHVDERLVEVCIFKDMRSIVGDDALGIPFSFTPFTDRLRAMYRIP